MDVLDQGWLADRARHWRPISLPRPRSEWLGRRARIVVIGGLVLLHALALWCLHDYVRKGDEPGRAAPPLWVEFVTAEPEPVPAEVILIQAPTLAAASASRPASRIKPAPVPKAAASTSSLALEAPQASEDPLRLYAQDGSLLLPDDLLDQVDRKLGVRRDFSFQRPGLDGMDKLLHRPLALEYQATRFDAGWRPEAGLLTSMLEKAVEKSTATIKIPVPGRPGAKLVCKLVLLAAGGGCGFQSNSDGYLLVLNDPATLNEEEQRQCQAWWDKIVGAATQEVWRRTRALYEAECRKPPEKRPIEPGLPPSG